MNRKSVFSKAALAVTLAGMMALCLTFTACPPDGGGGSGGGDAVVTDFNLTTLVTAPVTGATPQSTFAGNAQYTGTIAWTDFYGTAHTGAFARSTVYKAVLTLTAKSGYTFTGVAAYSFMHSGADGNPTNAVNSGTVTITFPASIGSDLKVKFGVSTAAEAFTAVHTAIQDGTYLTEIALGDYIDLDTLTIGSDPAIVNSDHPLTAGRGTLLRLIVVGNNSFKRDGTGDPGTVNANNPSGGPDHVVFQFRNIPVTHDMNATDTNVGGYLGSDMRTYITGDFLTGLQAAAGLTDAMLWAPARMVSQGGYSAGTDTITDTLWLPTVWEMFGSNAYQSSTTSETVTNQARLEYYRAGGSGDMDRQKFYSYDNYDDNSEAYWLASPYYNSDDYFAYVVSIGYAYSSGARVERGCVPAFCVK
ncbi:hypothetical protein FACS189476_03590 [Spirochaetia bacterium]|nr:hypothetical protein FACS189476_03590 [Spirochaetia bacterium]